MQEKIIGSRETVRVDQAGNLVTRVIYTYMLDDMGPFSVEMDKRDETAAAVKAEIEKKKAILSEVRGGE